MTKEFRLPPFDLRLAMDTLAAKDPHLAPLIKETQEFRIETDGSESPYEVLLKAIAYQSISGKAAATIFARVKALGSNGRAPSPEEMLKLRKPLLRKAGLSGAKIQAMKDLAKKTIEGIVPSLEEANKLSDEELVKRLVSVRGIGAWTVEMFLIFRLGRPDVLPIHDLGVRKGWAVTYGKKHMPTPKELLPSPVGICGAPASAPTTPPCAKSALRVSRSRASSPRSAGSANPHVPPARAHAQGVRRGLLQTGCFPSLVAVA